MASNFEDEVCTSNFKCVEKFEEGPICKVYYKGAEDTDCHIPCLTQNCSFTFVKRVVCERFECIGNLTPAKFVNEHLSLIIGLSAFAVGFILCTIFSVTLWIYWKKRVAGGDERRHLVDGQEDPNSTTPIIRNRPEGVPDHRHSRPISMHSLINLGDPSAPPSSSPPPPAYDDVARSSSASAAAAKINDNQPINSYQESLTCLEVAYRNVRKKTPKEIFRPHETMDILITALIPASQVHQPRHDLINPLCQCYECFLINLEQTICDNEKEN